MPAVCDAKRRLPSIDQEGAAHKPALPHTTLVLETPRLDFSTDAINSALIDRATNSPRLVPFCARGDGTKNKNRKR
jgi:hypothetical protein